ncbi:Spore coat protein A [Posidoniimonas polymericola]|uniref:Spore coat protein A n=1 Tax=Posidoniimonas polymericola TaxID=2528002 RepID=A0A5C5YLY4_9BACT|nr:multicopper oxidase family protein [Posidoniimonas polymericola]TWT75971.1 Spore coat protein A [Posidoniimonas polymericola]
MTRLRSLTLFTASAFLLLAPAAARAQNILDVSTLTKYLDPAPNPLASGNVLTPTGTLDGAPLYEVEIKQFEQQLHSQLAPTTLWGYNGVFPGPTFNVNSGETIKVEWTNNLRDDNGQGLQHILPYDTTIHGAGPQFPQARTVTHVHGAVANEMSDGFPEQWFSSDPNAPANGITTHAPSGPAGNSFVATYTNNQRAAGNWYHDHSMGITRLNVYAGMAGMYFIRDAEENSLNLPSDEYEIPILIQDRSFYNDGSLYYPEGPGAISDPLGPLGDDFPSAASQVSSFYADANVVNGVVWPYMEVEPRKYRLRLLNGANARNYNLTLEPAAGAGASSLGFSQIGVDGGLLSTVAERDDLFLAPADRVDVVVDFSQFSPGDTVYLKNDDRRAVAGTTDEVMQFRIKDLSAPDASSLPNALSSISRYSQEELDNAPVRRLELVRDFDKYGRMELLLDGKKWSDETTEIIQRGQLEIWEFVNMTNMEHPMHLHMEAFQVVGRQDLSGNDVALEPWELGWEDTVNVGGRETLRIAVKFDEYTGTFVWHCHILEHEDSEMMRTFRIVDAPEPGAALLTGLLAAAGSLRRTRRRTR